MSSSSAITHAADMAVAKLKARGPIDDIASALLDRIAELEAEADRQAREMVRLLNIEHAATDAFQYHRMGRTDDPLHDEWWDADTMISRMEDLGRMLERKA